jgi:hypothetical protein
MMEEHLDSYRVQLNGKWELYDLYEFPHAFSQCYAFVCCLDSELSIRDQERINIALAEYPWRGGYSYVNIYTVLQNQIPRIDRPRIKSIQYSSPGWIDIFLHTGVAIQIAKSVAALLSTAVVAAKSYAVISKTLSEIKSEREKAKLKEMQLTQAQHKVIISMCEDMAKFLGFRNVKALHDQTGNPEVSLKLLLAHYRRTKTLAKFVGEGKATLPEHEQAPF